MLERVWITPSDFINYSTHYTQWTRLEEAMYLVKHALPITIIKLRKVRSSIRVLLMLRRRFATANLIRRSWRTWNYALLTYYVFNTSFGMFPKISHDIFHKYLGPLHTQDWRPMTIAIEELSLVERAKTIQVHCTHKSEGLKAQDDFTDEKSTRNPTWQTMDKVSWSPKIFVKPTSKKSASHKFQGDHDFF